MSGQRAPRHGRLLADFVKGATFAHPWEVTVDDGMRALFAASFQDATPLFASRQIARELGFRDRPLSPMLLLNLGLSFSVHDVSEQAIAHLAYLDVRFPEAAYSGDTLRAWSTVIDARPTSSGERGIVHVRTVVATQDDAIVCAFERKALIPGGTNAERPLEPPPKHVVPEPSHLPELPEPLRGPIAVSRRGPRFAGFFEDFDVGDVIVHSVGRTVGESEHMQLTTLARNTHPLHTDEVFASGGGSFAKTRVVYGGLVLAWVLSLTSRDTTGNVLWDLALTDGAHPAGVVAGDTLFAATEVVAKNDRDETTGALTFRVVGVKNTPPGALLERGAGLFTPELGKTEGRVPEKVVEITRRVLVRKR